MKLGRDWVCRGGSGRNLGGVGHEYDENTLYGSWRKDSVLRALASLPEDLSSIPTTQIHSLRGSNTLYYSLQAQQACDTQT